MKRYMLGNIWAGVLVLALSWEFAASADELGILKIPTLGTNAPSVGRIATVEKNAFNWRDFTASAVIETRRGDAVFTCSGVAIDRTLVLTAAHCAQGVTAIRVSFEATYDAFRGNFINVDPKGIFVHPAYDPTQSYYAHDIAALRLTKRIPPTVILPRLAMRNFSVEAGARVERIGFGGRNGRNTRTWTAGRLAKDSQGTLLVNDSLSVEGDSGGPIYYRSGTDQQLMLIGIHSTRISESDMTIEAAAVKIRDQAQWLQNAPFFIRGM